MGVPGRRPRDLTRPGLCCWPPLAPPCWSRPAGARPRPHPARPARPVPPARPAAPAAPSPGGTGPAAGAALCSSRAAMTRLVVSRVSALPQNHLHFTFPAVITVDSPGRARAVAEAVCGLPPMPRTVISCPADLGVSYRLSFAAGSTTFPVVTVAPGGCAVVAGAGPVRSVSPFTGILGRPGPRHGHQRRLGAAGHEPGHAAHEPAAAGPHHRRVGGGLTAGLSRAGRFTEPDTSRKGRAWPGCFSIMAA